MGRFFDDLRRELRHYMVDHGYKQNDIGEKIGVSGQSVSDFLAGNTCFQEEKIEKLVMLIENPHRLFCRYLRLIADIVESPQVPETQKRKRIEKVLSDLAGLVENIRIYGSK